MRRYRAQVGELGKGDAHEGCRRRCHRLMCRSSYSLTYLLTHSLTHLLTHLLSYLRGVPPVDVPVELAEGCGAAPAGDVAL